LPGDIKLQENNTGNKRLVRLPREHLMRRA
jgi:hypothetical protein